jgi:putative endonuclease
MYVYILASKSRCLYVGVTNDLRRRVNEHRTATKSFTADYRFTRLVYFEVHERPIVAIRREKRIKALLRQKKIALIEAENPAWDDLAHGWNDVNSSSEPGEKA